MNILIRKSGFAVRQLTTNPLYKVYIHLKDHDKKINPKKGKLNLSFMDPKNIITDAPKHTHYLAKLKRTAHQQLQRLLFEDYKQKILAGKVDEAEVVEPDPLWGDRQKPIHYYKNLSNAQATQISHSIIKDIQQYQQKVVKGYLDQVKKILDITEIKDVNDYAHLAANFRINKQTNRQKYYEVQKAIGNKFHLLTNNSLILLKYAFNISPKQCTPQFNRILNDLLTESINQLSTTQLIHLMYFNRHDSFKLGKDNLQLTILQQLQNKYKQLKLSQKIDFLLLYIDSRGPTIRKHSHNRHFNQIRNKTQEIIHLVNLDQNLQNLSEQQIVKLTYILVQGRTIKTEHITNAICQYVQKNIQKMSINNITLMFIYLTRIQSNRSVGNIDLLKTLKQKILASWGQLSPINQIRSLDAMYIMNLYDEQTHKLYSQLPIPADNTMLGYFCRLQLMTSSGRQWEIVHRLTDLEQLPLKYFQDYKRFYNYVSVTAPDWDLTALGDKLVNTQPFYNSLRFQSISMDKKVYSQLYKFRKFSNLKCLPRPFTFACPIKNIQFAQFALPTYQISVDIVTETQKIRGTKDVKGSYLRKIKSLQNLGWKHLYVFQQDIEHLNPLQLFDYLYSICQPHFEQQTKVIAAYQQYRAYEIEQLRQQKIQASLSPKQLERYLVSHDINILYEDEDEMQQQERTRAMAKGNEAQIQIINEAKAAAQKQKQKQK